MIELTKFRSRIVPGARQTDEARKRRHLQYATSYSRGVDLAEEFDGFFRDRQGASKVGLDYRTGIAGVYGFHFAEGADGSVVDYNVDPPEPLLCLRKCVRDLFRIGDIEGKDEESLVVLGCNLVDVRRPAQSCYDKLSAFQEEFYERAAKANRCPRDYSKRTT